MQIIDGKNLSNEEIGKQVVPLLLNGEGVRVIDVPSERQRREISEEVFRQAKEIDTLLYLSIRGKAHAGPYIEFFASPKERAKAREKLNPAYEDFRSPRDLSAKIAKVDPTS